MVVSCISVLTIELEAMTPGTHFVFGSSMSQVLAKNELSAILVGLSSHALLDAIPHNDSVKGISLVTAVGAVVYAYKLFNSEEGDNLIAIIGGLAGMLPDLEHTLKKTGLIARSYYPTHTGLIHQPKAEPNTALIMELGVSTLCFKIAF